MQMRTNPKAKVTTTPTKRPVGKVIQESQAEIGMAAQIRRSHPGGFFDWLMDQKAIPFLSFKGIGVPPMAIIWFFVGGLITAGVYGFSVTIFRLLDFQIMYNGVNVWNGQIYMSIDPIIGVTIAVLVIMLVLTNIEYTSRHRVWILLLILWFTMSFAFAAAWGDFEVGKVGLISGYSFNRMSYDLIKVSPSSINWFLVGAFSGLVSLVVFVLMAFLNWTIKKLRK